MSSLQVPSYMKKLHEKYSVAREQDLEALAKAQASKAQNNSLNNALKAPVMAGGADEVSRSGKTTMEKITEALTIGTSAVQLASAGMQLYQAFAGVSQAGGNGTQQSNPVDAATTKLDGEVADFSSNASNKDRRHLVNALQGAKVQRAQVSNTLESDRTTLKGAEEQKSGHVFESLIVDSDSNIAEARAEKSEYQEQMYAVNDKVESARVALKEGNEEYKALSETSTSAKSELAKTSQGVATQRGELTKASQNVGTLRNNLSNLEAQLDSISDRETTVDENGKVVKQSRSENRAEIKAMKEQIKKAKDDLRKAEEAEVQAKDALIEWEKAEENQKKVVASLEQQISAKEQELAKLGDANAKALQGAQAEKEALLYNIQCCDDKIAANTVTRNKAEKELNGLDSKIAEYTRRVQSGEAQLQKLNASIEAAETALNGVSGDAQIQEVQTVRPVAKSTSATPASTTTASSQTATVVNPQAAVPANTDDVAANLSDEERKKRGIIQ